jgi:hypothetical protein
MTALSTLSDIATKDFQQESQQRRRTCRDTDYPYEWTEDDEAEPTNSSSYTNSSHQGSPQMVNYRSDYPSPSSRHSAGFPSATSSAYSFEDEKVMGSLEDRFPFLKEERKRTRKLLTAEQTRVLEAILEKVRSICRRVDFGAQLRLFYTDCLPFDTTSRGRRSTAGDPSS